MNDTPGETRRRWLRQKKAAIQVLLTQVFENNGSGGAPSWSAHLEGRGDRPKKAFEEKRSLPPSVFICHEE
jgi:hypothetical protein